MNKDTVASPIRRHRKPARPSPAGYLWSFVGACIGLGAIAFLEQFVVADADYPFVIGAFGATSVLLFGAQTSPLARPYNVMVGHLVSAAVGVGVFQAVGGTLWIAVPLAVAGATLAMQLTRSLHPPGGASALIAVVGSAKIHALGFLYVLYPVAIGAAVLTAVAYAVNNLRPGSDRWPVPFADGS